MMLIVREVCGGIPYDCIHAGNYVQIQRHISDVYARVRSSVPNMTKGSLPSVAHLTLEEKRRCAWD